MKVYSIAPTTRDQGLPKGQSRMLAIPSCDVPEAMMLPYTLPLRGVLPAARLTAQASLTMRRLSLAKHTSAGSSYYAGQPRAL